MRYRVKTLDAGGTLSVLHVDARDADNAGTLARGRGLSIVSVQREFGLDSGLRLRRPRFSVPLFAQQFIALLAAGLGTVEAIEALADEAAGAAGDPLRGVLAQVRQGRSLSDALAHQPEIFPPLFVATVRASERTGNLKEAIGRYVDYHAQVDAIRTKVVSASIYPALLAITGALVALFLLFYVVPKFGQIYDDVGGEMPVLSQWLMQWGRFLSSHALPVLAAAAAATLALAAAITRPAVRAWVSARLWALPRMGHALRIYQLTRFYRTLGMLLRSGMPVLTSLDLARGLLDPALRPAADQVRRKVNEGSPLSASMAAHGLTTPVAVSMLRVGEQSGELGAMMDRVAALYEEQLARWIDVATRLFEPLLMATIGIVIGAIVVLLYLPVFELASQLQ